MKGVQCCVLFGGLALKNHVCFLNSFALSRNEVYLCHVCCFSVQANYVFCARCGRWIHSGGTWVKKVGA